MPHIQILMYFRTTRNEEDPSRTPTSRRTYRLTSQAALVQSKEDIIPIEASLRTSMTAFIMVSRIDPPCARGPAHGT